MAPKGTGAGSVEPPTGTQTTEGIGLAAGIRIFSSASDAPRSRRPTDGVMLALAILGAIALAFPAPGPTAIDTAATNLVQQLPGLIGWFWEVAYALLLIWSLALLVLALFANG